MYALKLICSIFRQHFVNKQLFSFKI